MKPTIIISLFSILVCSCSSPTQDEIAISNYVQTMGNTKINLKFRLISKEVLSDFKASDSIAYLKKESKFTGETRAYIDTLKLRYAQREKTINDLEEAQAKLEDFKKKNGELNTKTLRNLEIQINNTLPSYKALNPKVKSMITRLEGFATDESKVLYKKIKCSYSIENPLLNNAKQEITSIFYFDAGANEVIGSEK